MITLSIMNTHQHKKNHPNKKKMPAKTKQKLFIWIISSFFILSGLFLLWISTFKMPDVESFTYRKVTESTKIYDRTGEILLYNVFDNTKRTVVPFSEISENIKNATLAIEDRDFYVHKGIKISSILRAVFANIGAGSFNSGGSTITQQVVKNSVLTTEKLISRKIKEWIFSLKLEKILTKDEIFSLYLNESPYGGNVYGVEEASKLFYGKKAKDVSVPEAAYLAAILKAPTYYSPFGLHKDKLEERKNLVLFEMYSLGQISKDEYENAKKETVAFKSEADFGIKAPHFVMFVKDYLEKKYGEKAIEEGGLKITTTLDWTLQSKAEELVKKYAFENKKNYNAENAALLAINPKTGEIITMVGSRDYFDKEIDGNFNIITALRQPGSSFKPFAYATAFMKGYTPETTLFDLKTQFDTHCAPEGSPLSAQTNTDNNENCYTPENYDGLYRGPISLRNALAQSINIPAIKTLYLAGIKDTLKISRDLGITTLKDANQYGLTLVLGGGEVKMIEMVGAYGVFANNGLKNPYTPVLKVEDKNGNILEEINPKPIQVLPEQTALQISDILSDDKARAPSYGNCGTLCFQGRQVAVKTGTTNDYKDAWIIGYTPSVVLGAWAGNNDNTPMEKKVAGFIIAPLWREFMSELLAVTPVENFKKPVVENSPQTKAVIRGFWQGNKTYTIDNISKKLATDYTPEETRKENVVRQVHSILYWVDRNNPLGPSPLVPENDPQFLYWEYPIQNWLKQNGFVDETDSVIPKDYDNVHLPENIPKVSIAIPANQSYSKNAKIPVIITYNGKFPLSKIDVYVNDEYVGGSSVKPFIVSFVPNELESISDTNTIKVVVYDSVWNKTETEASFNVI